MWIPPGNLFTVVLLSFLYFVLCSQRALHLPFITWLRCNAQLTQPGNQVFLRSVVLHLVEVNTQQLQVFGIVLPTPAAWKAVLGHTETVPFPPSTHTEFRATNAGLPRLLDCPLLLWPFSDG